MSRRKHGITQPGEPKRIPARGRISGIEIIGDPPRGSRGASPAPIMQYDLDGSPLRAFRRHMDAVQWLRAHGHPKAAISPLYRDGRLYTAYGYRWLPGINARRIRGSELHSAGRPRANPTRGTGVECLSHGVAVRRFVSMTEAARWIAENGRPKAAQAGISIVLDNPVRSAYGYRWRRVR